MSARRIVRLGRDGDGLAADGTAFPGALPGETVERDGDMVGLVVLHQIDQHRGKAKHRIGDLT